MIYINKKGLSLIELLISIYILLIGMCGILSLFINVMASSQLNWEITAATAHAEMVLEEMQGKDSLSEIIDTDWEEWPKENQLLSLPNEKLTILIKNPAEDPLDVQIINEWTSKANKQSIQLNTKLTK